MADLGSDRVILNPLEAPASSDWNQIQSQIERGRRDFADGLYSGRVSAASDRMLQKPGFVGDGFKVRQQSPASMNVVVTAGIGFLSKAVNPAVDTAIGGIVGLSDLSTYKPVPLATDEVIAVDAADAVLERWDIIEVRSDRDTTNNVAVNIYDSAGRVYLPTLKDKTLGWDLSGKQGRVVSPAVSTEPIGYKVGVPAAVNAGAIPATSAGYTRLAVIYVGPAVVSLAEGVISDDRKMLFPYGCGLVSGRISMAVGGAAAPTITEFQAPPGVQMTAISITGAGTAQCYAVVKAGGELAAFRPQVSMYVPGTSPPDTFMQVAHLNHVGQFQSTTAFKAQVEGALSSNPFGVLATVGAGHQPQWLSATLMSGTRFNTGDPGPASAGLSDPTIFSFSAVIGH